MALPLAEAYQRLLKDFGPQHWWPGESPFEVMVGAVLTQNTSWTNVERAILKLKEANVLEPRRMYELAESELAEFIRPAGYFKLKAKRLRNLLKFIIVRYQASLANMFATPLESLRSELLEVNGIGPETADSILLYAGNLPTFVIDAYTARVLKRHGWIDFEADYAALQELFHDRLPREAPLFNEYHALLVEVGKRFCHKRAPHCSDCPLRELLPAQGPLELNLI